MVSILLYLHILQALDQEYEVLEKIQRGFENQYNAYAKLKKEDIKALDYETMQVCKRLQRHITSSKVKD